MKYGKPNLKALTREQLEELVRDIAYRLFYDTGAGWQPHSLESDSAGHLVREDVAEMLLKAGAGPRPLLRTVTVVKLNDLCTHGPSYQPLRAKFQTEHTGGTITRAEFKILLYELDPKRDTDGVNIHVDTDLLNECDLVEFS